MFKRVLKRKIRQEREEELGIDSEMKEVLGMQDTDSDESDSSSDEGDSEAEAEGQGSDEESEVDDEAEDDEEDGSEEELDEVESVPEESDSDNEAQLPQMSVTDAVSEPIYLVSLDSEIKACILCPGKLLKNSTMADVHRSSKAHNRRFTRFVELVAENGPDAEIRDLLRTINEEQVKAVKTTEPATSKRAAKRRAKTAALKEKREKSKKIAARRRKREEAKLSKAEGEGASDRESGEQNDRPKKRRKVEKDTADETREDASEESPAKKAPRRPKFKKGASSKFQGRPRTNAKGPRGKKAQGKNGAARAFKQKPGQKKRASA